MIKLLCDTGLITCAGIPGKETHENMMKIQSHCMKIYTDLNSRMSYVLAQIFNCIQLYAWHWIKLGLLSLYSFSSFVLSYERMMKVISYTRMVTEGFQSRGRARDIKLPA